MESHARVVVIGGGLKGIDNRLHQRDTSWRVSGTLTLARSGGERPSQPPSERHLMSALYDSNCSNRLRDTR